MPSPTEVFVQVPKGSAGATGATGPTGPAGPTGPKGTDGDDGSRGIPGPRGATGASGPQGPRGPDGQRGQEGVRGERGPEGKTGSGGSPGSRGPAGAPGPHGPRGDNGPRGEQGSTGPPGINWRGEWKRGTYYEVGDGVRYVGSSFINKKAGTKASPNPDRSTSDWDMLAQRGDDGRPGPAGSAGGGGFTLIGGGGGGGAGATGSTGPSGAAGAAGGVGATGAQGITGSSGPTGATGPAGGTGATGPAGADAATLTTYAWKSHVAASVPGSSGSGDDPHKVIQTDPIDPSGVGPWRALVETWAYVKNASANPTHFAFGAVKGGDSPSNPGNPDFVESFCLQGHGRNTIYLGPGGDPDWAQFCSETWVDDDASPLPAKWHTSTDGFPNDILFTAVEPGTIGNEITVKFVTSALLTLAVSVVGTAITVNLAHEPPDSDSTSTAAEVVDAVTAHPAASALVTAELTGSGASFVQTTPVAHNLADGGLSYSLWTDSRNTENVDVTTGIKATIIGSAS